MVYTICMCVCSLLAGERGVAIYIWVLEGGGLFVELARIFRSRLIFGKTGISDMYGLGGGGGVGDHIFSENQGGSQTLPGFWAVCAEYAGHELGSGREPGIVPTRRHYNQKP